MRLLLVLLTLSSCTWDPAANGPASPQTIITDNYGRRVAIIKGNAIYDPHFRRIGNIK